MLKFWQAKAIIRAQKKTAKIALSLGRENAKEKNEKFNYEDEIRSFVKNL